MPGSNEVPKGSPKNSRRGSRSPYMLFATSNRGKMDEAIQILRPFGISLRQYGGKGAEIQADTTSEVAAFSSREAARRAGRAVLVEDAGFFVDSLYRFPRVESAPIRKA